MSIRFTLFGFKTWNIHFEICFVVPSKMFVVFNLVVSTVFHTPWSLKTAHKDSIFPFPAVFALRDFGVHISYMYSFYVITDIETSIDKVFSFCATLGILYFNLDDCYVRLRWHFDNSWFGSKNISLKMCVDLIMDLIILKLIGTI